MMTEIALLQKECTGRSHFVMTAQLAFYAAQRKTALLAYIRASSPLKYSSLLGSGST